MKKLVLLVIVISFVNLQICAVNATPNTTKHINKEEYPDSSLVKPQIYNPSTLEGSIGNTINVNLEDCLKLALGNSPKIQAAMQDIFAADERLKQVWSNYFPQFSWQSGYSRIRQLQLSDVFQENLIYNFWVLGQISGTQLLYDFGITSNQAKIRKLDSLGYKIILTNTINEVVYNVKDAYYNLQYTIERKLVAEESVKEFEGFYEQAKSFYEAGTKSKVDVTIAMVNLSNAKLTLIQAEHAEQIAMAQLNNAIGIPYYTKYKLADKLYYNSCDINLDNAIKISENSRPEFQLAEIKVEQAKQNIKLIKKSWYPQFITQGQFEVGGRHPDSNYGYTFGAYLNFPTINGMLLKHQLREAKIIYSKEQANCANTKNDIYLEVQNAYYLLDEKRNKIPVAFLGMKQAKENYELSNGRYKAGVTNAMELKEAQVQYENAQLTYCQTIYEFNSAKANLEKSIGRNISNSDIELNNKQ